MEANELRALQAPLKERYRQDPQSARIEAQAVATIEGGDIACRVPSHAGVTVAGLHPAAGGDGGHACSADMLMEALVSCAGVTLKAVATAMRIELRQVKVIAKGAWDARGTLAVDREAPIGLTSVELLFQIDSPAEAKKLEKLVELTERYCVVLQTLAHPPALASRLERFEAV
jgi:uncharacterized OsmC-like protein